MGEPELNLGALSGAVWSDRTHIPADARLECKICWWVYDPADGDPDWQIAPGTPFADLPAHWRCPQCDAEASKFLLKTE